VKASSAQISRKPAFSLGRVYLKQGSAGFGGQYPPLGKPAKVRRRAAPTTCARERHSLLLRCEKGKKEMRSRGLGGCLIVDFSLGAFSFSGTGAFPWTPQINGSASAGGQARPQRAPYHCQSAHQVDPRSASNFDPLDCVRLSAGRGWPPNRPDISVGRAGI